MSRGWSQKDGFNPFATTPPDARVAERAAGQWGVVTLADLRSCGLSYSEVKVRVRRGYLHPLDLGAAPTRSPLEDRVYDFIVRSGLERPLANPVYRLPTRTVFPDLYWPRLRLVVEVDGRQWHDDPLARADDAQRQAELEAAGE